MFGIQEFVSQHKQSVIVAIIILVIIVVLFYTYYYKPSVAGSNTKETDKLVDSINKSTQKA